MDIARVAKRLWNEAGRPPGRYVEYWVKAERAAAVLDDNVEIRMYGVWPVQTISEADDVNPATATGPPDNQRE